MSDAMTIRIFVKQESNGNIEDSGEEYSLVQLGGILPVPGDLILSPSVPMGQSSFDPANREIWEVLHRAFNARDLGDKQLGLIVRSRAPEANEEALLPHDGSATAVLSVC